MNAQEIFEVLERTVGAPTMKEDFIHHVAQALETKQKLEYRFQGNLDFGGKLWINHRNPPYVTCYKEHETEGRKMLMELANQELLILYRSNKLTCEACELSRKAMILAMNRLVNIGGDENRKVYEECERTLRLTHRHVSTNRALDEALNSGDGTYKP